MSWYTLRLHEEAAAENLEKIQDGFDVLYIVHQAPRDAALFEVTGDSGERDLFFSPGALKFASTFIHDLGAVPSAPPAKAAAMLLVGQLAAVDDLLA